MSRYDIDQFVKLWAQERLTPEQAVGQLLLHLRETLQRLKRLEERVGLSPAPGPGDEK